MPRISSSDRRISLIDAAIRVIGREGVHGATTRAIVAEAQMSLASFHYVFTSRDEMLRELIDSIIQTESLAALSSIAPSQDIHTALRRGLQAYFDLMTAEPAHEQAMTELLLHALRTPELADLPNTQYSRSYAAVTSLLDNAAARAGVSWSIPTDDVARLVVALTDGVTLTWLADRNTPASERILDFAAESIAALAVPLRSAAR
jgi:AcrR family transcriptional regulator